MDAEARLRRKQPLHGMGRLPSSRLLARLARNLPGGRRPAPPRPPLL